ncbi:hypothetical protein [Actinophytocola sediminis]
MRFGKLLAGLLMVIGVLVVPATSAQADESCAPTANEPWLGNFNGPHNYHTGELYGVLDVTVYIDEDDEFRIMQFNGYSSIGYVHENGMLSTTGGFLWGMSVTSATCDSDGNVTRMSGNWWKNWDPECISCADYGPFDVVRT